MNIPEELIPVIDWWQKDGKKTLAIVACAGVVALGVYLWMARENRLDVEAAAYAYGSAGNTTAELQDALAEYAGRDAAGMIKLRLAKTYAAEGDYANALKVYTELTAEKSLPASFELAAVLGVASSNEALGNWAEARKAYDSVLAGGNDASPLAFEAKLGSARCLAFSGDRAAAVKELEAVKAACADDKAAVQLVDGAIDTVKRWQKREKPAPAPAPVAAPAAAEKPAEKPAVKASELTLPAAAPKAPAAAPKAPVTEKPAPAPAPAK